MYQGDEFEDPRRRIDAWNIVVMLPNSLVGEVILYVEKWFNQTQELGLINLPDLEFIRIRTSGLYELVKCEGDAWALNSGLSSLNVARWGGSDGMIAVLRRLVARAEAGERIRFHPLAELCFSEIGIHREMALLMSRPPKRGRLVASSQVPEILLDMGQVDLILALRARLVRLLGWPQLYRAVKRELHEEVRIARSFPLASALPYDPFDEMQSYLGEMEARYPIVLTNPFPSDRFPISLLGRIV